MSRLKILMSNLGYARGINGSLPHHIAYAHRHVYCPPDIQKQSLVQLTQLIETEDPDICCFVEIDKGASRFKPFNQLEYLLNEQYAYFDIENKYGQGSYLRHFPLTRGKSNGFMAKQAYPHEKMQFRHGVKRLVYKIALSDQVTLFFAHFSLKKLVRHRQLLEVRQLLEETPGEIVFMGDFNVLTGLSELTPLLSEQVVLLNRPDDPTFTFHRRRLVLDLCLCSRGLADRSQLKVVPQPFSDHAALLLTLEMP